MASGTADYNTLRFSGGEKIALEDLARLIAPKRPRQALAILRCFYPKNEGRTFEELMRETGIKEKALRYYITRLKRWRLIYTMRGRNHSPAAYCLDSRGFHARIDTMLVDPVTNLSGLKWQPPPSNDTAKGNPTRFIPEATGRCHSCDVVGKTNSDNLCKTCFEEGPD